MSRMCAIGLLVLCLTPASAPAQVFYAPFDVVFGDTITLLRLEEVQKDMNLEPKQLATLKDRFAPIRKRYDEGVEKAQKLPVAESMKEYAKLKASVQDDAERVLPNVLKPDQMKRYRQICLQQRQEQAFADADVQKALRLTDTQKQRVKEIAAERDRKLKELKFGTGEIMAKLRKEQIEKTLALLTPEQMATWQDLVGKPLEIKPGMLLRLK